MRVLVDINHPAHVHFFRQPIRLLHENGHEVMITSRDKEVALDLLESFGLQHVPLSAEGRSGLLGLGIELMRRDAALYRAVRRYRPDVLASIGGTFIAHVGRLTGVPSLVFYDTENATLQNAITYPFVSCVIAPRCYGAWLPRHRHIRYDGYHELSYLRPPYFQPDRSVAVANGLAETGSTFLVRLVSWKANHDLAEHGWNDDLLTRLVERLSRDGKVLISSERALPKRLEDMRYRGDPAQIHHVMGYCRAYVGESATMASECAVLGVPAIYAATTGRGYTDEQEQRYGLVVNLRELEWFPIAAALESIIAQPADHWAEARRRLLEDTIDVAAFVADCITTFPAPLRTYQTRQAA